MTEAAPVNRNSGPGVGVLLGGLAVAAVVGAGVWAIAPFVTNSNRPAVSETTESPAAEAAPEAPASGEAGDGDAAPITVDVNLTGDAWMRVTADGEVAYEGTLATGSNETWTAEGELTITAGNAGAVLVSFNGASETPMGNPGTVQSQTFTPEGTDALDAGSQLHSGCLQ